MISAGYKSVYQQGYSDAMRDFRKKSKTDVLDKIRAEIDVARFIDKDTKICKNANASGLEVAMKIIDKYKTESEGEGWKEKKKKIY